MPTTTITHRSTDELLTCPCCGASRAVRRATMRYLSRVAGDAYYAELHRIVTGNKR
ncbi:hypothetical protein MLP_30390 [Microlunatus phosphovorus NM-1]|uniref:Uncharacterized protein n=1 Tax=Microlunatus phosphovorus (strain ATCC 700054 / DSM 10555 / JCM 9379 / NBRC 101784 / NCIMB 13414 / VKM Ac-1990 / NM-1) TaxID=1032480 RepID=F5XKI1_MICPN|nr:hypothetical protein [Microlunatus phosphovorus]BAK36053.1 hypothetical protein MLP_30390 [Microlunatus phosphovorus NM-1]